jgi:hypothetical protein
MTNKEEDKLIILGLFFIIGVELIIIGILATI